MFDYSALFANEAAGNSELSEVEIAGWDSVDNIFLNPEAYTTQGPAHLIFVLSRNLKLAQNTDAAYFIRCPGYFTARARRIEHIIEILEGEL